MFIFLLLINVITWYIIIIDIDITIYYYYWYYPYLSTNNWSVPLVVKTFSKFVMFPTYLHISNVQCRWNWGKNCVASSYQIVRNVSQRGKLVITTEQPLTRRGSDGSNRLIYALVRAAGEHRQDYDRMPVSYPL